MRQYGFQNEVKSYLNRLERENGFRISSTAAKQLNDRVESLKKSGVWSQYGLGFNDVDGDAYLTRASVTDLIGRAEVLWFVRGMKALGLYSNMVAWPMRSYQNAGTGSTVYSLGGLGVYNGTMINSPTWGTTGVTFINIGLDTNSQYISVSNAIGIIQLHSIALGVGTQDSLGNRSRLFDFENGASGRNPYLYIGATAGNTVGGQFPNYGVAPNTVQTTTTINLGQFYSVLCTKYGNVMNLSLNNANIATTNAAGFNVGSAIYTFTEIGAYMNGKVAMALLASKDRTPSEALYIYSLYKNTLGNNLGLT